MCVCIVYMCGGRRGGGRDSSLQLDQLSILEHGGDRLDALHAEEVVKEPVERPRGGMSKVFMGA